MIFLWKDGNPKPLEGWESQDQIVSRHRQKQVIFSLFLHGDLERNASEG